MNTLTKSFGILTLLYLLLLSLDITWINMGMLEWRGLSKGMLMPVLIISLLMHHAYPDKRLFMFHCSALFLSWAGDLLLYFGFFIPGLLAFLTAHIFYIQLFTRFSDTPLFKSKWMLLLFPAAALGYWFTKDQPNIIIKVVMYSCIIVLMAISAFRMRPQNTWVITGALVFIISDFLLANQLFKTPVIFGDELVMLTYGLAQLFILIGMIRLIPLRNT